MTKVTIEDHVEKVYKFSDISRGEFFKDIGGGKVFIKCNPIKGDDGIGAYRWNALCVDSTGTIGWHSEFNGSDVVIPVKEVIIKI